MNSPNTKGSRCWSARLAVCTGVLAGFRTGRMHGTSTSRSAGLVQFGGPSEIRPGCSIPQHRREEINPSALLRRSSEDGVVRALVLSSDGAGGADFRATTMQALFESGARCAPSGRLWATLDETMSTLAAALPAASRGSADREFGCPARDLQAAVAGAR
jgi:hypothetical protein